MDLSIGFIFHFVYVLESITLLNPETKNLTSYTSEKPLGGTWTDKVMSMKEDGKDDEVKQQATNQGDAAEDDEWVSTALGRHTIRNFSLFSLVSWL